MKYAFPYVSVKKSSSGMRAVCLDMASSFSLSVRGTEWIGGTYLWEEEEERCVYEYVVCTWKGQIGYHGD